MVGGAILLGRIYAVQRNKLHKDLRRVCVSAAVQFVECWLSEVSPGECAPPLRCCQHRLTRVWDRGPAIVIDLGVADSMEHSVKVRGRVCGLCRCVVVLMSVIVVVT